MSTTQGTVAQLWRYPVKSLLGEECEYLDVNVRGVVGDRLFAIRGSNGKFGSGKTTRRFRQIDGLLQLQSVSQDSVPVICFPNGRTMRGDDPEIHAKLSEILGQPVTVARETSIAHLDAGPIHLLTTAALRWLRDVLPDVSADERRFRPNLVIDVPGTAQIENTWLGKTLTIGDTVKLRVSAPTERCAMVSLAQRDLPSDARILRYITQESGLHFGAYAEVVKPGKIMRGDRVTVAGTA